MSKMEKSVKEKLLAAVENMDVVPQRFIEAFANEMGVSKQSIYGVLRVNGKEYEKPTKEYQSAYSEDEEKKIINMVKAGKFIEEIAEAVGKSVRSVRGKCLALLKKGLIESIPAAKEKKDSSYQKSYTDEEEAKLVEMIKAGKFVEDIAEALGKSVQSVRGKCLALLRAEVIDELPKVKNKKEKTRVWTDEKVEKLKNVYLANNKDLEKTAKQMGVTVQSARYALSRFTDVYQSTAKPKTKFWTDDKVNQLQVAYKKFNADVDKIANELGTTNLVIYKKLKELGLEYKTKAA